MIASPLGGIVGIVREAGGCRECRRPEAPRAGPSAHGAAPEPPRWWCPPTPEQPRSRRRSVPICIESTHRTATSSAGALGTVNVVLGQHRHHARRNGGERLEGDRLRLSSEVKDLLNRRGTLHIGKARLIDASVGDIYRVGSGRRGDGTFPRAAFGQWPTRTASGCPRGKPPSR